jgi:hypothetical protein
MWTDCAALKMYKGLLLYDFPPPGLTFFNGGHFVSAAPKRPLDITQLGHSEQQVS